MKGFWRCAYWILLFSIIPLTAMETRGEVPSRQWAALATYGGAGMRYTATPNIHFEGRVLAGDGMAGSLRGAWQWDNPKWKVRPLAGIEFSVLVPVHGNGDHGQAMVTFLGGEVRLSHRWTIQLDMGPGLFRLTNDQTKKDSWEYENVLNLSLNYYFGKNLKHREAQE